MVAGFGTQRNVELLVQAGFSAPEAVKIATYNGAHFMGAADRIGMIEPGKLADLIVIDGNPAENIAHIRRVKWVFKDGIGYDSAKLIEAARGWVGVR